MPVIGDPRSLTRGPTPSTLNLQTSTLNGATLSCPLAGSSLHILVNAPHPESFNLEPYPGRHQHQASTPQCTHSRRHSAVLEHFRPGDLQMGFWKSRQIRNVKVNSSICPVVKTLNTKPHTQAPPVRAHVRVKSQLVHPSSQPPSPLNIRAPHQQQAPLAWAQVRPTSSQTPEIE